MASRFKAIEYQSKFSKKHYHPFKPSYRPSPQLSGEIFETRKPQKRNTPPQSLEDFFRDGSKPYKMIFHKQHLLTKDATFLREEDIKDHEWGGYSQRNLNSEF